MLWRRRGRGWSPPTLRWRLLLGARPVTEVTEVTAGAGSGGRLANLARPGRGRGHTAVAESRNSRKPPSSSSSSSAVSVSARPRPRARQHAGRVRSISEVKLSGLASPRPLSMVPALGHSITPSPPSPSVLGTLQRREDRYRLSLRWLLALVSRQRWRCECNCTIQMKPSITAEISPHQPSQPAPDKSIWYRRDPGHSPCLSTRKW